MQVGLKTSTSSTSIRQGAVGAPQSPSRVTKAERPRQRAPFPEAALISRRPLRYNVLLNQQLTSMQQADNYLAQTESKLLQLRHRAGRHETEEKAGDFQAHLSQRAKVSGGTIDRQFALSLQQKTQVSFSIPGSESWVQSTEDETLIFALGAGKRQLAAVNIQKDSSPRQALAQLNVGLGRIGIHAERGAQGELSFSTDEEKWSSISQMLSVKGEGHRYPENAFTLLSPKAESAIEDELKGIGKQWGRGEYKTVENLLERITSQRSQLYHHKERVNTRIQDLSTALSKPQANIASQALKDKLANCGDDFQLLTQALGAQANIGLSTVKNLLG